LEGVIMGLSLVLIESGERRCSAVSNDREPSALGGKERGVTAMEAMASALLGAVTSPGHAAAAAAFFALQPVLVNTFAEEYRRRIAHFSREVFDRVDPDEAIRQPQFVGLVLEAAEAATRTQLDGKRAAIGRALARGFLAQDQAEIDVQGLLIRTLAAIEALEIRTLALIELGVEDPRPGEESAYPEPKLRERLADKVGEVQFVCGNLNRLGLVIDVGGGVRFDSTPPLWRITDFGRTVLGWLREAGEASANSEESPG
jgi:hypothetical protein